MFLNRASDSPYFSAMSATAVDLLAPASSEGMYPAGTPPVVNVGSKVAVSNGAGVVEIPFCLLGDCVIPAPLLPLTAGLLSTFLIGSWGVTVGV